MKKNIYIGIAIAFIIVVGSLALHKSQKQIPQAEIDKFAKCLGDKGAKFYGAFWCSHCEAQKKLFNNSKNLPYVECSTSDGNDQTENCKNEKISGYPTWKFSNGEVRQGEQSFSKLSELTKCEEPK